MPYFLIDKNLELYTQTTIDGDEARHILLSRRMKVGDYIEVQDPQGKRYKAEIRGIKKNSVEITTVTEIKVPKELSCHITLFQSAVSEKILDFILQKTTELGVFEIVLFNSQNTAAVLSQEKFISKFERWNKILWEAAKQSGRGVVPKLSFVPNLEGLIECGETVERLFVLESTGENVKLAHGLSSIGFVVGPEGGLSETEKEKLKFSPHSEFVNISPFTLRSETAAIAGLSILQHI